ncbi:MULTISPECIES: ATP-binding protein [Acinetobacter]|uniref:ATP-binding protein n=1 Tax=Acinetobacter TaxID=469 RepID=UPI000EA2E2F8|nr:MULTISPECIES: ATP-binding protein [Acinetobacter]RKG42447.1 histidine kinase [Acinetobacter cumulans]RZG58388.1 histidine kinase [Acinetobacter sp. WCHAc060006]
MSVKSFNFRARARTIEHLGKGQIADCPTAVSELWKNAYDAYARDVALFTVDTDYPCGALIDNGCGMSPEQIIDNWLIVGTESKSRKKTLNEEDRFGIPIRQTQGEKGIGRLSAAFLANVTFLVTKKLNGSFTSLLVDWRLFENPYLSFEDISIPFLEFDTIDEITIAFDLLKEELIKNVNFEDEDSIKKRAWERFSEDELENNKSEDFITTQNNVLNFCQNSVLDERAISPWNEILNKASIIDGGQHGTALFLLDLRRDLTLLTNQENLGTQNHELIATQRDLIDTLRAFTNPYVEKDQNFSYEIFTIKQNNSPKPILNEQEVFGFSEFSSLEHIVVGEFDEKGWFKGNVKAFGQDKGEISIAPNISINPKSGIGPFKIQLGSFEYDPDLSSLDKDQISTFAQQGLKYGGLLIFRDNLRVLPYGRLDNDFFEIEARRTNRAGDFYFSTRRTFGYVGITHQNNRELIDKSGREGFIRNSAAIQLKELVSNLLIELAYKFFGSKAEERQELILIAKKIKELRKEAQTQARKASQKSFKNALKNQLPKLDDSLDSAKALKKNLENVEKLSIDELQDIDQKVSKLEIIRTEIKTPTKPPKLGIYEEKYREYRDKYNEFSAYVIQLKAVVNKMESELNTLAPQQTAKKLFDKNQGVLNSKLNKYLSLIEEKINLLNSQWKKDISEDRSSYYRQAINIVEGVEDSSHLENALNNLDIIYLELVESYTFKYDAILKTLEKISEGINLDSAFSIAEEERSDIEEKMRTINAVAQLGISVEILSHELEEIDSLVTRGLNSLPSEVKAHPGYQLAYNSHKALTSQIRFLSPLKISGYQSRQAITGKNIEAHINQFYGDRFTRQRINFEVTEAFRSLKISDLPSRIYPVFINLINNAMYWVSLVEDRKIKIDLVNDLVVVANSGPKVDEDDVQRLFDLFYTKRANGRGVGLYLCRENLAVAHHKIWYAEQHNDDPFIFEEGANFIIKFNALEK